MEYYAKHNPAKLLDASGIEATLEKYKGREESLFSALHQKYEPIAFPNPPDDKDDTNNGPTVFLEFGGSSGGTVQIQLFAQATPVTVENFRCLCTGEIELPVASNSYTAEDRRPRLCFRHSLLHRIVPGMCVQGGDITVGDGTGGRSIYPPSAKNVLCHTTTKDAAAAAAVATPSSRNNIHKTQNSSSNNNSPVVRTDMWGNFDDEQPFLAHSTEGLLSMANNGPNRNNSQFFVTLKALPHLNGKHVVFGRVTCGMDVIRGIASDYAASISTSSTLAPPRVEIVDCGEIETHPDGTEIWHRASALDKEDSFREHDDNDTSYSHVDSVDSNSDTREETNESSTTATSTPSTRLDGSNSNTFAGACAAADDSVDSELVPCPSLVTHAAIHVKTGGGIIDVSIATGGITSELVCQIIPSTPCVASDSSDTTIALSNPCYNESKCKPVSGTFINDALLIEHNSSTDNVPETQGAPREDATGVSMPVQGTSGPKSTTGARNYAITASLHHDMDVVVVDTLKSAPTTNSEPSLGTLRLVDDPIIGLSLSPRIPSDSPLKQPITAPGLGTNRSKVLPSEPPEAAPTASTTSEPSDNTGTVACTSQFYNEIIESSSIGSPTRPTQSSDVSFAETDGSDAGNRSIATGDSSVVEQIENLHRELDTTREQLRLTHLKLDKQRESLMSRQDGRSGVRPPRFNKTLTPSPQRRDTHRLNAVDDSNSYSKKSHTELLPVAHITAPPDHPDTCGFNSIRRVEKSMSLEKDFIPDSEANTPCEIASLVDNSVDER